MRTYTEEEVHAAYRKVWGTNFLKAFNKALHKEEPVLFTKDELLAGTATEHEKIVVHGIFAMLGTTAANDNALLAQAAKAGMRSGMQIMIDLAKATKEEAFQPGQVVRDANGIYYKMAGNGRWMTFEHAMFVDFGAPQRPLEKMP